MTPAKATRAIRKPIRARRSDYRGPGGNHPPFAHVQSGPGRTVVQAAGNTHNGSETWTYSIEDSKFDFIANGETLTLNYVAQVDDGHGGVVSGPDA